MHDFENLIPDEILTVIVNRKIEKVLKKKVELDMAEQNLSTETPDNVYEPNNETLKTIYNLSDAADEYAQDIGEGYSFDLCKW
jgi:hypothetical protein